MPEETVPETDPNGPPAQKLDLDLSTKGDDKAAVETNDPRKGLPASVRVEDADTPYPLDTTKRVDPNNQYIQYNGVGTVRQMGPGEWKAAGVDSEDYFEWNSLNQKRIARSAFTDAQLQYLLRVDDRFELVEVEPEKASETTE